LAEQVKLLRKSFLFIRTNIDGDKLAEQRKKNFNEEQMLEKIRNNCCENLEGLIDTNKDVFLISNHHQEKWDFPRLEQAIIDSLPFRQSECITLSLHQLTSLSKNILEQKIKILRGSYTVYLNFVDIQ
jgi:iron uptake system EfeUOB component EfeO/EfeM